MIMAIGGAGNISVNTSNAYRALAHASNIVGHVHNDFDDGYGISFLHDYQLCLPI